MPLVSIVVPCRNERRHLGAFAASALAQELPAGWSLEILIADGQSDDGTRELLAELAAGDARVAFVENPQGIVSAGLNRALVATRGEVVVRMDVHTEYASDYVAQCLIALETSGADNVGGPWRAAADADGGPTQAAAVATFQSRWVAGGALSRRLDYDGPADTVYLGAWPRRTFERFGGFDENLVRNQDDEHNLRIALGGGRLWQSSRIRSRYKPRRRLGEVFRQYLQYGYWKPFVMRKHGQPARARQLVPGMFVAAVAVTALVALAGGGAGPLLALVLAYAGAVAAMTAAVLTASTLPSKAAVRVPAVIVTYHVAYGLGSIAGAFDAFFRGRGRERFASLTR